MSAWDHAPVLGVPPQQPVGSRSPGRDAQNAAIFDPVRVAAISGSASTGTVQIPDLGTFSPPNGVVALYVVAQIIPVGGAAVLYLYTSPSAADPVDLIYIPAAGIAGGVAGWVPQSGRVTYAVQLATATSYTGFIAVAGWMRNP